VKEHGSEENEIFLQAHFKRLQKGWLDLEELDAYIRSFETSESR
jgi:hypothetical protein